MCSKHSSVAKLGFGLAFTILGPSSLTLAEVSGEGERLSLGQQWEAVRAALGTDPSKLSDPALRLIAGHAALALNANNESLCLFLSVSRDTDARVWEKWTTALVQRHDKSPIAHYFRGDALARSAKWDEALKAFDRSLRLDPKHTLTLNARGVCRAAKREWDKALLDFVAASQAGAKFADAHASLGAMWIQKNDAPKGALDAFNRALEISPDSLLARNGRACARIVLDQWEEAERELEDVRARGSDCLSALTDATQVNLAELGRLETDAVSRVMGKLAGVDAGMTTEMVAQRIRNLTPQKARQLATVLPSAARWNKMVDWATSWAQPLTPKLQGGGSVGISGVGPYAQLSVGATWDSLPHQFNVTRQNLTYQQQNIGLLQQYHNVAPARLGPIGELRARIEYRDLIRPTGGVTTETIGAARVDTGNWNVVTFYGLLYKVRPESLAAAPDREPKGETSNP